MLRVLALRKMAAILSRVAIEPWRASNCWSVFSSSPVRSSCSLWIALVVASEITMRSATSSPFAAAAATILSIADAVASTVAVRCPTRCA